MATTVRHTLTTPAGRPVAGSTVRVSLGGMTDGTWTDLSGFVGSTQELIRAAYTKTDQDGLYELDLVPNSAITPSGTGYKVTHPGNETLYFVVPDSTEPQQLTSLLTTDPPQPSGAVAGASLSITDVGDGTLALTPIGLVQLARTTDHLLRITIGA